MLDPWARGCLGGGTRASTGIAVLTMTLVLHLQLQRKGEADFMATHKDQETKHRPRATLVKSLKLLLPLHLRTLSLQPQVVPAPAVAT